MVLSYRHGYHAGNVGDVVKHSVLALLLTSLATRKVAPFLYLDSHAAAGQYDLRQPPTPHSEYHSGIAKLWTLTRTPPSLFPYLHAVRSINHLSPLLPSHPPPPPLPPFPSPTDIHTLFALPSSPPTYPPSAYSLSSLSLYPGSPALFLHLRRPHDRLLAYELHSTERANLSAYLASPMARGGAGYPCYPWGAEERETMRACRVMEGSGWDSWAVLPQPERRGLVLVDPPYEVEAEYEEAVRLVTRAVRRWATATYAVWYPLLAGKEHLTQRMLTALQQTSQHSCTHPTPHPTTPPSTSTPTPALTSAPRPCSFSQTSPRCWTCASPCARSSQISCPSPLLHAPAPPRLRPTPPPSLRPRHVVERRSACRCTGAGWW